MINELLALCKDSLASLVSKSVNESMPRGNLPVSVVNPTWK